MPNQTTPDQTTPNGAHFFDIAALASTLPAQAATMLTDIRLTDEAAASCRIFRVHRTVPAHYHTSSDEYLYVLTGRAEIVIEGAEPRVVGPGELIFFRRNTVHAMPRIVEEPYTVLAVDTPRRPPEDVHFVDPAEGTAASFIKTQAY
jgi:mannose-6-phosphate isomerase-like protein (cupin superfamily)